MRRIIKIDPRIYFRKTRDLIDEPVIVRVNEFDEESLTSFERDMDRAHRTGQPVIPIVIDSYGGSSYAVLGMVNSIEAASVPVATIISTKAMSAGAILFSFGTEGYRFMHPEAWLMVHDVAARTGGKIEDMKADVRQMDELNLRIYRRMSRHLGHKPEYIGNLIRQNSHVDWFLSAKEAKRHNIANHLRIPKFEVEIGLTIRFQ